MKDKTFIFILIIIGTVIISGFTIYKLHSVNERSRNALPYLLEGERVDYFELTDQDAQNITIDALYTNKPVFIFIFSRPCSPCNKNIAYWKKIAGVMKNDASVYGIVLGSESEAFSFSEQAKLNFPIYTPQSIEQFKESLRLKLNIPQTLIVRNGKVSYLKMGELDGDEATQLIVNARNMSSGIAN